ncbi:ATP-binding protein [Saccharothrix sp. NRRL B-16348]|nr:ATP-binding protein [Saccharothrix sp. NRRL B-16348]
MVFESHQRRTEVSVEVRVGIADSPRELVVSSGLTPEEVEAQVQDALKAGTGQLVLVDQKGARYVVPAARIAYVEIGPSDSRRVGFISGD